jgi:proline dehydrogenase
MTLLDRAIASALPAIPQRFVHQVAKRYIAGEAAEDAFRVASELNRKGFTGTMDILGEHVVDMNQAQRAASRYVKLLGDIETNGVQSQVSIKLTQFGLNVDRAASHDLAASVIQRAKECGNSVCIDMEDSSTTTDILEEYRRVRGDYSNVGVAIQAYLRRTMDDVERLAELKPSYRLCKGVYVEAPEIAFTDMPSINRNYVAILKRLLKSGSYVAIATHDFSIVQEAWRLIEELKAPRSAYEFQMLLGVREDLRDRILAAGHPLRIYIPYGPDWYAYSVRRLRENPRLAGYVLKALFRP